LYPNRIVGLDLPGTRIDQSISLCMMMMHAGHVLHNRNRFITTNAMYWSGPGGRPLRPIITGCAVAQHSYNGDVRFLWEKLEFDLL